MDLGQAFTLGRDAASQRGRELASVAALGLGDLEMSNPDQRRLHYERAAQLGKLSGREQGRRVAEQAEARLREMAD